MQAADGVSLLLVHSFNSSWRGAFYLVAAAAACCGLVLGFFMREVASHKPTSFATAREACGGLAHAYKLFLTALCATPSLPLCVLGVLLIGTGEAAVGSLGQLWLANERGIDPGTASNTVAYLTLSAGVSGYWVMGFVGDRLEQTCGVNRFLTAGLGDTSRISTHATRTAQT